MNKTQNWIITTITITILLSTIITATENQIVKKYFYIGQNQNTISQDIPTHLPTITTTSNDTYTKNYANQGLDPTFSGPITYNTTENGYMFNTSHGWNITETGIKTNTWSISFWAYKNTSLWKGIIYRGNTFKIDSYTGNALKVYYTNGSQGIWTGSAPYNTWSHYVIMNNETNYTSVYRDGIYLTGYQFTSSPSAPSDSAYLYIGSDGTNKANISLSRITFFNRTLNANEAQELYILGRTNNYPYLATINQIINPRTKQPSSKANKAFTYINDGQDRYYIKHKNDMILYIPTKNTTTNSTNWQDYSGNQALSYIDQTALEYNATENSYLCTTSGCRIRYWNTSFMPDNTTNFTISIWEKINVTECGGRNTSYGAGVFGKAFTWALHHYGSALTTCTIHFGLRNKTSFVPSVSATLSDGWFHYVGTYTVNGTNGTLKLYINGALNSTNSNAYINEYNINERHINIKGDSGLSGNYRSGNGTFAYPAIWNRTLNDLEIQQLYKDGFT